MKQIIVESLATFCYFFLVGKFVVPLVLNIVAQ